MSDSTLYRAVWRWHFYAGLIILPFLVWLATTGAIYLFKPEIERAFYGDWITLARPVAEPGRIVDLITSVQQQTRAKVVQVGRPATPTESWRFGIEAANGDQQMAFVQPDTGLVLGVSRAGGPVDLVKQLHSLAIVGPAANVVIEIVAGWAIVLGLTGFYLWWPRTGRRALSLAGRLGERRFWRNFHASVGSIVGAVILFLAVTGMPWTTFWGARFHAIVAANKLGRPTPPRGPAAEGHEEHLPWSLQGTIAPHATGKGDVGPDAAVYVARAKGLSAPWILDLPTKAGEPYRIAPQIDHAQDARMIYVDPSNGNVLGDIRWRDFGVGAKAFEWGIYTHQGQEFGEPNRLVMLSGCVGVWLLAISGSVMWWKRRKAGQPTAPPRSGNSKQAKGVAILMLAVGGIFPLTGLTMLAALLIEIGLRDRKLSARY